VAKATPVGDVVSVPAARGAGRPRAAVWQADFRRRWWRQHWLDVLLVLPPVFYVLFFTLVPVGQSICLSFVRASTSQFTFANYENILDRGQFKDAFVNTIGITLMGVSMEMVAGVIIALMLARGFRERGLFRSIVLVPLAVPTLVADTAMLSFVSFNGYLNRILLDLGIIDVPVYWQQSGLRGMFAIAVADLWKTTPLVVLIVSAGLAPIAGDLDEAASVDGAARLAALLGHHAAAADAVRDDGADSPRDRRLPHLRHCARA
jgi:trehalose transport system permease protein